MADRTQVAALGSSGPEVSLLQGQLLQLGHKIASQEIVDMFFGSSTRLTALEFQRQHGIDLTGVMDPTAIEVLDRETQQIRDPRRILGRIRYLDGKAAAGLIVSAFDRDMRSEQRIGQARTDDNGIYEIEYSSDKFARAEKGAADLFIRVLEGDQTVYDPPIDLVFFNAGYLAVINVDLSTSRAPTISEYDTIYRTATPLLDGVPLDGLQENERNRDLTFLVKETGIESYKLAHFAVAQKLASLHKLPADFFYALFAERTLLGAAPGKTSLIRFEIDLTTDTQALFFDIVLLPAETVTAAVKSAVTDRYISEKVLARLDEIFRRLAASTTEAQSYIRDQRPRQLFGRLEQFVATGKMQEIMSILHEDTLGDLPRLFQRLNDAAAFRDTDATNAAKTYTALADAFGYEAKVIDAVKHASGIERPEDLPKLAHLNRAAWKTALRAMSGTKTTSTSVRDDLIEHHAQVLQRKMEQRFPTAAFIARLADGNRPIASHHALLRELTEESPDFDLARTNIDLLLKKRSKPADDRARVALKQTQRVFKLTPTYAQTTALMDRGITSSAAIHAMSETRFMKLAVDSGAFSTDEARITFRKAADVHTATGIIAGEMQAASGAMRVAALKSPGLPATLDAVTKDFPNMKSLFQGTDYCACMECRTVHSAAAYVVDALQFLKNRLVVDTTKGLPVSLKVAKDVLFARRADLGDLDLSCDNTNTPLPYIDVVCELLEEAVSPDPGISFPGPVVTGIVSASLLAAVKAAGFPFTDRAVVGDPDLSGAYVLRDKKSVCKLTPDGAGGWLIRLLHQTYGSAEELAAAPAYLNEAAYAALRASDAAFRLPFDLFHQETRSYLAQFDIVRADLMDALRDAAGPQNQEIAADYFGLSERERQLIVTPAPASQPVYWNTGATPAENILKVVDTFVTKTELEYSDLEQLLAQSWVNPNNTMFIRFLDNTCDLTKREIQNLDAPALDRLHRFIRLWKKTGWEMAALDRAIRAPKLGNESLDDTFLTTARSLSRVAAASRLSIEDVCDLYDVLPTIGENSRYAHLFLNVATNGPINDDFLPANVALNEQKELLTPGTGAKLSSYESYLATCLGISLSDATRLVDSLGAAAILSAANIATVYAMQVLARALRLAPAELLILRSLTAIDPLVSPVETFRFIEKYGKVRAAGVRPADLQYLLAHEAEDLAARVMGDEDIVAFLKRVQISYQDAFVENRSPFNPVASADDNRNAARNLLAVLPGFADSDLARMQSIFDDTWSDPALTPPQFIDQKLSAFVNTLPIKAAQAAVTVAALPKETERKTLIQSVVDAVAVHLFIIAKNESVVTATASTFKLAEEQVSAVLDRARLKQPVASGNRTLLDLLTDDALIDKVASPPVPPAITAATFPDQFRALRLLHKMAWFLGTLKLSPTQARWMLDHNNALGWMELDNLTYEAGIPLVTLDAWERLQDALVFIRANADVDNPANANDHFTAAGLFDLVLDPTTTIAQFLTYLAQLTGWDLDALTDLDTRFVLSAGGLAQYRLPATYIRLENPLALLRRLGLKVAQSVRLIKPVLTAADAALMRQALKSRYADQEWLGALRNVQDRLRQQKRDALVAFLLAVNPSLKSSNDLYDYFLIDVEMCSCMPTSRIVQAHATVQLFVQRCLMGLEPRSVANIAQDAGWKQWSWMANFRVWEANRKIFLWPEDWYDEFLRDDKSELFREWEDTLQQNELTDLAVENAFAAYLEKLDDIAQLDIMSTHYQTDMATMHVVARTKGGDPSVYYYRQFQHERYWTPWEKVPVDITGNQLLAFDHNTRLTLAWPIFTEESDPNQSTNTPAPGSIPAGGMPNQNPMKRWKIQLAVTERAGNKWQPKKVSKDPLLSPQGGYYYTLTDQEKYNFFLWDLGVAGQSISVTYKGGTGWVGSFLLAGCKGYPEPVQGGNASVSFLPIFKDSETRGNRFTELGQDSTDDLSIQTLFTTSSYDLILAGTPGVFKITYPMQMSIIDWLLYLLGIATAPNSDYAAKRRHVLPLGTFMPYFYGDWYRSYVIIPDFYQREAIRGTRVEKMFSDIYQLVVDSLALGAKYQFMYQSDPAHDLAKLAQELKADPEFLRLQKEAETYQRLQFGLKFKAFYHPMLCLFRAVLNRSGIPALLQRNIQLANTGFDFHAVHGPSPLVVKPYPQEDVDFDRDGAYAGYNWELFFHMPLEMAMRLNQEQRFEEARNWLHYIFNPVGATDAPAPNKFWITKPFFLRTPAEYLSQRIDQLLYTVAADPSGASIPELNFAIGEWRSKPFQPHVIARSRPVTFQLATVVEYVRNLVEWGDNLFRMFTRESVTQATHLYILADKLLGPKPRIVPPAVPVPIRTYNELESHIDLFSNALLDLENLLPDTSVLPHGGEELPPSPFTLSALYFCIPPNETLLKMWSDVEDRLFKIRHCKNIDGIDSPLALFSPPIDPGALVRAVAGGLDISAFLAGLSAPLSPYKFTVQIQKAADLTQSIAALGNSLLAALEKRDGEDLAQLRAKQEVALQTAVRAVKIGAISEAESSLVALQKNRLVTEERKQYYAGQSYMNPWEGTALGLYGASLIAEAAVAVGYILSGGLKLIPNFVAGGAGFGGTPEVSAEMGGQTIGNSAEMAAQTLSSLGRALDKGASMASTQATYQRRQDEWDFQVRLAEKELAQTDQQIATAKIQLESRKSDLAAHDVSVSNAQQVDVFMRAKYTNKALYDWMVGQISSVYFAAYKLAFDTAKTAERCYQHELGVSRSFLRFGYWDSLKKGLMTAEALQLDLKRMEMFYLQENKRERELTKDISLAQLDPLALLQLKTTGKCLVNVPESWFDLDHPGHYMRRIKSVSLSIPCVAGPYTSVSCKLSLLTNRYRKNPTYRQGVVTNKDKYAEVPGNDDRFTYQVGSIQSIATSTGRSDSGMFELNFHDDRYLPFEGTGAIGIWQLEMPSVFRSIDPNAITDAVLHYRYTAKDAGSVFRQLVESIQRDMLNEMLQAAGSAGLFQGFNLRQQFPNEWAQLKQSNTTQLTLGLQHFPLFVREHGPAVDAVRWFAKVKGNPALYVMRLAGVNFNLNRDPMLGNLCTGSSGLAVIDTAFTLGTADASKLEELTFITHYIASI